MGAERASTTRQRERGKICAKCGRALGPAPAGYIGGERRCDEVCALRPQRVQLNFQRHVSAWTVTFLQGGQPAGIPRQLRTNEALLELLRRSHASDAELVGADHAIRTWGRGTVFVQLTDEQFAWLQIAENRRSGHLTPSSIDHPAMELLHAFAHVLSQYAQIFVG